MRSLLLSLAAMFVAAATLPVGCKRQGGSGHGDGSAPEKRPVGSTGSSRVRAIEAAKPMSSQGPPAIKRVKVPSAVQSKEPRHPIDDPSGTALNKFFDTLMRVENKEPGATARILYYGDGIVASDFVTGKLRRMLQERFGDSGHGYAALANAWKGSFHIDVSRSASNGWGTSTCVGPYADDGVYGLGCASFTAQTSGAWSEFGTTVHDQWGRAVSSFEIEFYKQPGGGGLRIVVDDQDRETISTSGPAGIAYHRTTVVDGSHKLRVVGVGDGPTRVFGIRMERDRPGVTLSALGITGAQMRSLATQDDAQWARALQQAKPDLVCLAFGTNEVRDGYNYDTDTSKQTPVAVMKQLEAALPNTSFMLVGPPDVGHESVNFAHSHPNVSRTVAAQKQLAEENGWAFWNQYQVMGGAGAMWAWRMSNLGSSNLAYPTENGASILGRWQYTALMDLYEKRKDALRTQ